MREALQAFSDWTGGAGVCVPAVHVTGEDDLEGALGRWDGNGRSLKVSGGLRTSYSVVVHELCHAWDEGAGFPTQWRADLFPPDEVEDLDAYPSAGLRIQESFARVCEDGPVDLRLAADLAERCGLQPGLGPEHFVAAQVYAQVRRGDADVLDLALERTPLDATLAGLRVLDVVAGGGRLWVLAVRARPFSPLQPQRIYHVLLGLDPLTGDRVTSAMFRREPDERRRFRLVGGQPGPLLVEEGPDEAWVSAVDTETGRPDTTHSWPAAVRWESAVRLDDALWTTGIDDMGAGGLATVDWVTGVATGALLDPPLPHWREVFGRISLSAQGELVVGGFTERLGAGALIVDPATRTWRAVAMPEGAETARLAPLPDGRIVTGVSWYLGDHRLRTVAVLDREGGIGTPAGCTADRISHDVRFVPAADGLYLYEDARQDDGIEYGRWLTRVVVP